MSAPTPLSVLDLAPIREGSTPAEALQRSLARGRLDPRVERERRSVKRALFAAARDSDQALFPQPTVNLSSAKVGRFAVGLADIEIRVPHVGYADRVQEIHIKVIHTLILLIEKLAQ